MKYESELICEILEMEGHKSSSLHYESECIEEWVESVRGAYPKLCDYEGEWLNYYLENGGIGEFPYEAVTNVTDATIEHTVPIPFKSAILSGQTLVNSRGNTVSSFGWSTTDGIEYIVKGNNTFLNFECTLLPNAKYLIFFEFDGRGVGVQYGTRPANGVWDSPCSTTTDGICKKVITTGSDSKWLSFIVPNSFTVTDYVKISRIMIIPYQDGMEDWDIPYFEGMSSVKTSQTLVNIVNNDNWVQGTGLDKELFTQNISIKKGQTYTVIGKMEESDTIASDMKPAFRIRTGNGNSGTSLLFIQECVDHIKQTFTNNENDTIHLRFYNQKTNYKKLMIIEGDYTNQDIPYFEGMQSVKMPVLTTTGKNLFDEKQVPEQLSWGDNVKKANVKENTAYVYSSSPYTGNVSFKFYDNNNEILQEISIKGGTSFTTPPNTSYLKTHTAYDSLVQIEEGTQATAYEPFKSNILTVNEEVELRAIGDVKDELNLLTGELSQRIGEVVFDGSEDWKDASTEGGIRYSLFLENSMPDGKRSRIISDYFPYASLGHKYPSAFVYGGSLYVYLEETTTLEDLKTWLGTNKPSVQYQLKTESIRTVGLTITDQEGESVNQLKAMNETTHIKTNGTPIKPLFTGEIPVEAIEQNLNSFIEQEGEQNE